VDAHALPRRTVILCGIALAALGGALLLAEEAQAQAIIDNGVIQLGVDDYGSLNVWGGPATGPACGFGTTAVGLRYMPTGCDATSPGCLCEGWGVAYDMMRSGWCNQAGGCPGASGTTHTLVGFSSTSSTAVSTTRVGVLEVTHDYHPYASNANVYEADVEIKNVGTSLVTDVLYRRAMDWDIMPTAFSEEVTIGGKTPMPTALIHSSDNGFATNNPLAGAGTMYCPVLTYFTDCGPNDHGAVFTFNLGDLAPGESHFFNIYYGATGNEADAMSILTTVLDAELYSLGQTSSDPAGGTPNTFFFAFNGLAPGPKADFGWMPGLPCHDDFVKFDDLSLAGSVKFPLKNITWDLGDGTVVGPMPPGAFVMHKYTPPVGTFAPWTYTVNLTVWDTNDKVDYAEKKVKICNEPPTIDPGGDRFVVAGYGLVFDVEVIDPNKDPIDLQIVPGTLPPGVKLVEGVPGMWSFYWKPEHPDDVGVYTVQFTAKEKTYGLTDTAWMQIEVLPRSGPPEAERDADADGIVDTEDNCPHFFNPEQTQQGVGPMCDDSSPGGGSEMVVRLDPSGSSRADRDGDGVPDTGDVCPDVHDMQEDLDGDGLGDACEDDMDGDGVVDLEDNCVRAANAGQEDADKNGVGDACDGPARDRDGDGVPDHADNCVQTMNPFQRDVDGDGAGDLCDPDLDGDGLVQADAIGRIVDNCPYDPNPDQADADGDGVGDACEGDLDGDGIEDRVAGRPLDNCPLVPNPDQADHDGDGIGDACDATPGADAQGGAAPLEAVAAQGASLGAYVGFGVAGGLLVLGVVAIVMMRRRAT